MNNGLILLADRAALASMRIEPGNGKARFLQAEPVPEIMMRDPAGLDDQFAGQRLGERRTQPVRGGLPNGGRPANGGGVSRTSADSAG